MNLLSKMRLKKIIAIPLLVLLLIIISINNAGMAQQATSTPTVTNSSFIHNGDELNSPANLSNSGAASQPRIVAAPNGIIQVFWIDQFDGLLSSTFDNNQWSKPFPVPLPTVSQKSEQNIISSMPEIIEDSFGNVHVFWYGKTDPTTQTRPLYHSQMAIGSNHWLLPSKVANSAISFAISTPSHGNIRIAYIRPSNQPEAPAGIYYKYFDKLSQSWSPPRLVYTSIYYRLITSDTSWIKISANQKDQVNIIWFDPENKNYYSSFSSDNGTTWTEPDSIQPKEEDIRTPRSVMLSQLLMQNWEKNLNKCILEQKMKYLNGSTIANSQEALTTTLKTTPQWSSPTPILQSTSECPEFDRFFPDPDNNIVFWLWGLTSNTLYLSAWKSDKKNWSEPKTFSFNFTNPKSNRVVILSDLHATLMGGKLAITGTDNATHEIWFIQSEKNPLEMTFSEPSPWQSVEKIQDFEEFSLAPKYIGSPAISVDNDQVIHIIWSQSLNNSQKTALFHSDWDGLLASQPSMIFPDETNALHRQINLYTSQDNRLYLTWVQNQNSEIFFSWAIAEQAYMPDGWMHPIKIQSSKNASSPLLGADALGNLYLLYVISFNEDRGVYFTQSHDRGETWDEPKCILNGAEHNIKYITHPAFSVSPTGGLYVAYVNDALPGSGSPLEIDFLSSADQGKSWSEPFAIANENMDFPKLVISKGNLHLLYGSLIDNTILHRWVSMAKNANSKNNWEKSKSIFGFFNIFFPFDVSIDGSFLENNGEGSMHLVGMDNVGNILYSQYQDISWSQPEFFNNRPAIWITGFPIFSPLLSASTNSQGGLLGITWFSLSPDFEDIKSPGTISLFLTSRSIPQVKIDQSSLNEVPTPTFIPTESPLPTFLPTTTPIISNSPVPAPENSYFPLVISVSLAGFIIFLILIIIFIRKNKRNY